MNNRPLIVPTLALLLCAAQTGLAREDHDHDHDHAAPTTTTAPAESKPKADAHDDHDHDGHEHKTPAAATQPAHDPHDHAGHDHGDGHGHKEPSPAARPANDPHDHAGHDHAGHGHGGHGHAEESHADEVTLPPEALERNGIKVGKAERRAVSSLIVAPGRLAFDAEAMAHVGTALSGRAAEIKVRVGDAVGQGDELLVIESIELGEAQSNLLQKRTARDVARAAVEPTQKAYERAKLLHAKSEGIALAEVQKRQAEFQAATGAAQQADESFAAATSRLQLLGMSSSEVDALLASGRLQPRLVVRAPLGGAVIEREVTLGERVGPEKERLLVIAGTDPLWVLADVPESRIGEVAKGGNADVTIAALPGTRLSGKVTHVAPALDPQSRTVRVRIEVANPDGKLLPGMFAHVAIAGGAAAGEPVVVVPDDAVQIVEGASAVFVPADEPNTFAKRVVKVGRAVGGMVPILEGLKEGDAVVVSGSFLLKADLGKSGAAHEH